MSLNTNRPEGGVHTLRRVITYILLFLMVVIAAIGLSGLMCRLLDAGNQLLADDTSGLAQSLAFTLIAGPLAAALWWLVWRGLRMAQDNASVAWPLYLMLASTTALITAVVSILSALSELVTGRWSGSEFATGLVWGGVWIWHRWMLNHPTLRPSQMRGVTPVLGSLFGLAVGTSASIAVLGQLGSELIDTVEGSVLAGEVWWMPVLRSAMWAAGGVLVWCWFWLHDGVKTLNTGFARVSLVAVTGAAATALTIWGTASVLHVALRLLLDQTEPAGVRLDPLGVAVAAALIGALVWRYYRGVVSTHPAPVREANRLVISGVALAATATGVGIIINSLLAGLGTPLAESGLTSLLLAGITAFVVGAPLWWVSWTPRQQHEPQMVARPGRRIYLVSVFGVSALVALITLILIAFRLFELGLDGTSGQGALEGVRAPLGLLTATLLVAAYHFALWRGEKPAEAAAAASRAISHIILVTGGDPEPARVWAEGTLGARVTIWQSAVSGDTATDAIDPQALETALTGITDRRVLAIHRPKGIEIIPLAE